MTFTSGASNALATCYPLTCSSEECASSLVATQKRREEITPENLPRQGMTIGASRPSGNSLVLRPYQERALAEVRSLMAGVLGRPLKRVMLYSPTGSGKTEMALAVTKGCRAKRKRVAFLCNRVHLVTQASRCFSKAGVRHGVIQGANTRSIYEDVLVASIQTVARRGMPEVDLIIIDEAHGVAGSKDFRRVIEAAKCPVIGLSATPFARGLGKHYDELGGALFEDMVVAATIAQLIGERFLVDCDVYAPSEPDMSGIKQTRNAFGELDYSDADIGRAVDKAELVGDIVTHWRRLASGTPTVCFASNIAHSKHIVEQFRAAGVPAEHVDCYTDDDERQAILQRIETGETLVISNVGILAEGWDFPACRTLILARPTRSLIRYLQMVGRVLRPHETKERALVLDHSGTVSRLGFPTDDFPLELDDGKPKESSGGAKKDAPLPKACPSCSYVKPATVHKCPVCGFEPERQSAVEVEEGELVLLQKGAKKASKFEKQSFYSQLTAMARTKGYSDGWAGHKYREYFGVWPRGLQAVAEDPTPEMLSYVKHMQIRFAKSRARKEAA